MFVHLHVQSHYSFLESIIKTPILLKKVQDNNMEYVGITDINGLYGALEFIDYAKKYNIQPVIWVQLWRCTNKQAFLYSKDSTLPMITILAKNIKWLKTLMKLVSKAHSQQIKNIPWIGIEDIKEYHDNILIIIWGINSRTQQCITTNNEPLIISTTQELVNIVGVNNIIWQIVAQSYDLWDGKRHNTLIRQLWQETGIRLYAGSPVLYIDSSDVEAYEISLCIKDGLKRTDQSRRYNTYDASLRTESQVRSVLLSQEYDSSVFIDELIEMTMTIAQECVLSVPGWQVYFPNYYSADRIQQLYETNKDLLVTNTH